MQWRYFHLLADWQLDDVDSALHIVQLPSTDDARDLAAYLYRQNMRLEIVQKNYNLPLEMGLLFDAGPMHYYLDLDLLVL